jgi:hypothetical protein
VRQRPSPETAAFVEFIAVVSCGFVPMSAGQLGEGTVFEVKCLFAIDAIAAVYVGDEASDHITFATPFHRSIDSGRNVRRLRLFSEPHLPHRLARQRADRR